MGNLIIGGAGIRTVAHLTPETRYWLERADILFTLIPDQEGKAYIQSLTAAPHRDLTSFYQADTPRLRSYQKMVTYILKTLQTETTVCVLFYGHPAVFVWPSLELVKVATQSGHGVQMLPGISAADCLYADLGIDPARYGCQQYEVTDFLLRPKQIEVTADLILWQIGVLGNFDTPLPGDDLDALPLLEQKLTILYGETHQGYLYKAAATPGTAPMILRVPLAQLSQSAISTLMTLYVPGKGVAALDAEMVAKLGVDIETVRVDQ